MAASYDGGASDIVPMRVGDASSQVLENAKALKI